MKKLHRSVYLRVIVCSLLVGRILNEECITSSFLDNDKASRSTVHKILLCLSSLLRLVIVIVAVLFFFVFFVFFHYFEKHPPNENPPFFCEIVF